MKKVRLGLIGAGGMASRHLGVIRDIDWIEAAGITSRTRPKAEALAKEHKISVCADDIDSLIKQAKPDALMVLVNEDQASKVAGSAIPYGLPVFIEKPPGLTPQETYELAQLAKKHSTKTMVGFNRRYYSIFHKGMEIIHKHGALVGLVIQGHERMWRVREPKDYPEELLEQWIFANSTHTIDLLRFFGGEPKGFKSLAHRYYKEKRGDQFAALMDFDSGAIGQYNAFWYSPGGWAVTLYGQGVTVEFKPLENGHWIDKDFKVHEIEPDQVDVKHRAGFLRQMEAFGRLAAYGESQWPLLDLEGAYKTMLLADKISSDVCDREGK